MQLPEKLQTAITLEVEKMGLRNISQAREELTDRYRNPQGQWKQHKSTPSQQSYKTGFMSTNAHHGAYVSARLPATYAVAHRVLHEIKLRLPNSSIQSLLDLGAGPGSVMWAACAIFSDIQSITLIEKDKDLALLGQKLASHSDCASIQSAQWQHQDLNQFQSSEFPKQDLITFSYSIGELSPEIIPKIVEACWKITGKFLVIIEPGTPAGFERIRDIRSQLIQLGAHLIAPCPHTLTCPMSGGNWCHFSERIERSSLHRRIKEGTLGHEDEKFSYIIGSRIPCDLPESRILRHPLKRSGHVVLTLCTPEGLKQETVSKRTPEAYKYVRKVEWGDTWQKH